MKLAKKQVGDISMARYHHLHPFLETDSSQKPIIPNVILVWMSLECLLMQILYPFRIRF